MVNCSGKCKSNETIFPNLIRLYLTISLVILSISVKAQSEVSGNYQIKRVVIDAGHGGKDPGAVGKITYEKHITLAIALKLGAYIQENLKDVEVTYTRSTDVFIPLDERSEIANKNKADLFISIHVNSLENPAIYGTSSWVMGEHKSAESLAIAQRENSVISYEDNHHSKYEGFDPHSPESHIMFAFMTRVFLDQSLNLAAKIQDQFRSHTGRIDRGVNQAGFVVLWKTSMPSVLVETGFISNATEEKFLRSDNGQDLIASAIFRAFRDYKNEVEGRKIGKALPLPHSKEKTDTLLTLPVYFSVQLKSSPTKISLNSASFQAVGLVYEVKDGGVYKYYAGRLASYQKVSELKTKARQYFSDAFTVAFENGKKIPINAAIQKTQKPKPSNQPK